VLYGTGFYASTGRHHRLADESGQRPRATSNSRRCGKRRAATAAWRRPTRAPAAAGSSCTPDRVIRDGVRPAAFPYTSPLATFEFVRIPGRPGGTTPQEALNPLQRMYNATYGQVREHVNLLTNPKGVIDAQGGMKPGSSRTGAGENYVIKSPARRPRDRVRRRRRRSGRTCTSSCRYPRGVPRHRLHERRRAEGDLGTSGEQLKEARFNTDRFLGPTMRRSAGEYGRMFETWRALYPLVWDLETTISYAGEDNIARTITVYPEMFKLGLRQRAARCRVDAPRGPGRAAAAGLQDVLGRSVRPAGKPASVAQVLGDGALPAPRARGEAGRHPRDDGGAGERQAPARRRPPRSRCSSGTTTRRISRSTSISWRALSS
jgi:hypothetical protein